MNNIMGEDLIIYDSKAKTIEEFEGFENCSELLKKIAIYLDENDKKVLNYLLNTNREWLFSNEYKLSVDMREIATEVFNYATSKIYKDIEDSIEKIYSLLIYIRNEKYGASFRVITSFSFNYYIDMFIVKVNPYIVEVILRKSMEDLYGELLSLYPNSIYKSCIFKLYKDRILKKTHFSEYHSYDYGQLIDYNNNDSKKIVDEILKFLKSNGFIEEFEGRNNVVRIKFKQLTRKEIYHVKSINISV